MLLATILLQITPPAAPKIPLIDLAFEAERHIVVDQEAGQYLGHPTTCLLEDGQTVLCVYPKGHGKGGIVFKRSTDGGMTWSERLPTPENWATSREVPTLHRIDDPVEGGKRLLMFSGLAPTRMASSDDDGQTWTELEPIGDWGAIVARLQRFGHEAAVVVAPHHHGAVVALGVGSHGHDRAPVADGLEFGP
ncbi:MAG: sialidase family protein, partial [Planctomycetota bacterium]